MKPHGTWGPFAADIRPYHDEDVVWVGPLGFAYAPVTHIGFRWSWGYWR